MELVNDSLTLEERQLFKTKCWTICFHEDQTWQGRVVVERNPRDGQKPALTHNEREELFRLMSVVSEIYYSVFGPCNLEQESSESGNRYIWKPSQQPADGSKRELKELKEAFTCIAIKKELLSVRTIGSYQSKERDKALSCKEMLCFISLAGTLFLLSHPLARPRPLSHL